MIRVTTRSGTAVELDLCAMTLTATTAGIIAEPIAEIGRMIHIAATIENGRMIREKSQLSFARLTDGRLVVFAPECTDAIATEQRCTQG